jgi:hypothetical protein
MSIRFVHSARAVRIQLRDEQHVQALEQDRADMEEITGQQAFGLRTQERPSGGVHPSGPDCAASARDQVAVPG